MEMLRLLLLWLLLLSYSMPQSVAYNKNYRTSIPHLDTAISYVGEIEVKPNRSKNIDKFNNFLGIPTGASYCASYVSYCCYSAKVFYPNFKSPTAQGFIVKNKRYNISAKRVLMGIEKVPDGSILIFKNGETWKGHTAFVIKWNTDTGITVEANTSPSNLGSIESQRNGDGIHFKKRKIEPYNYFRITDFLRVEYEKR